MSLRAFATLLFVPWLAACGGSVDGGSAAGAGGASGGGASGGSAGSFAGSGAGTFVASPSVARRLSRGELDNTLRDLLGDDTSPATRLLAEDLFSPYDNNYDTQVASGALIDSLEGLATEVADRVALDPARRDRIVPCTPADDGDAVCFRQFVESFGLRAFRRPLSSAEVDPYMTLLDFATEDNPAVENDFYTAVGLVLRSVLQDPEFLYRIEIGTATSDPRVFALGDYEIATRLSYLLWGTTPDDALLDEAAAGAVQQADDRRTVALRMLDDQRARVQLHRFHAMWLGYRAVPHAADLAAAFQRETSALLDRVIFDEPQNYLNLFTFPETKLDTFLADHYGLPEPSGGEGWVPYADSGRAGLLSHGSVLSAFSKFTDTSPTQRGIFVRTRLLCQQITPPPPNVNSDQPPGDMDAVCKYERYEQHRSSASCAGCHSQMDPIGFGLENYDIAGRFREHDDGLPQCTIAGEGEVVGYGAFSGPAELGQMLVEEELIQRCITSQFFQFAIGRAPDESEAEAIDSLHGTFGSADYVLKDLIVNFVSSEAFALRMEPEEP